MHTDPDLARLCGDVVDRWGIAGPLERHLRPRRGPTSALTVELLLKADMLTAASVGTVLASHTCRVIAGLDPQAALGFGDGTPHRRHPISSATIRRLRNRIWGALDAGFADDQTGESFDLKSAAANLVAATVPPDAAAGIEACAVDSVPFPVTARAPAAGRGVLSGFGGPVPGCSDPDARIGWHYTAAGSCRAGLFAGYDAVIAIAGGRRSWQGDVDDPGPLRADCPPFVVGVSVEAAGRPPGPAAADVVRRAMLASPRIAEVVADRRFTSPADGFARPLHAMGVNTITDLPRRASEQARPVSVPGRGCSRPLLMAGGEPYPLWMPRHLWSPPPGLKGAERAEWFNRRSRQYAYVPVSEERDGDGRVRGVRFQCPICAGKAAAGPNGPSGQGARAGNGARAGAPEVAGPAPGQPCCAGTVMVDIGLLDLYQRPPFGTDAHACSYASARTRAESALGRLLHRRGIFDPAVCRSAGLAAHTMAVAALAAAHNIWLSRDLGTASDGSR